MQYQIDPAHSAAQFKIRHMGIANLKGEFDKVSGTVNFDPADLANSSVDVAIDVSTISTRAAQRDEHLKTKDLLNAGEHPNILFKSKRVEAAGGGAYKVTGDLTIRGITQEVVLEVSEVSEELKDPWGNPRRGAEAKTRIDRNDFGLSFNAPLEGGGMLLSDYVDISIDLEMMRKPE